MMGHGGASWASSIGRHHADHRTEEATVSSNETTTDAARVADVIRSPAAGWRLAAERLEAGDLEPAHDYARLGQFGTEDVVERIAALVGRLAVEAATVSGDAVQDEIRITVHTDEVCPSGHTDDPAPRGESPRVARWQVPHL
jgi:nitrogen-specific signal transduction histidine kinase